MLYKLQNANLREDFELGKMAIGEQKDQNIYSIKQQASDQVTNLLNSKNATTVGLKAQDARNALSNKQTIRTSRQNDSLNQTKLSANNTLTQIGLKSQNRMNQMGYQTTHGFTTAQAINVNDLNQTSLNAVKGINQKGIRKGERLNAKDYQQDVTLKLETFNQSTIPGFDLAQNTGQRQLNALYLNTYNQVNQAATPYREAVIIDPPEPIAGLKPELKDSKEVYVPSTGSILLNTFTSTAGQALASARTDASGNTVFW